MPFIGACDTRFSSFEVSSFRTSRVAHEIIKKSMSTFGDDIIILWLLFCDINKVSDSTQILLFTDAERMYFSLRVLNSSKQFNYSFCVSWLSSKSKSINSCLIFVLPKHCVFVLCLMEPLHYLFVSDSKEN